MKYPIFLQLEISDLMAKTCSSIRKFQRNAR